MKVYKYRGANDENIVKRDLQSLAENYFWAATSDKLNDPAEAYVHEHGVRDTLQHLGAVEVESAYNQLLGMRHTSGVYSLSQTPFDELMWAYYSNGHQGFCIEYELERLVLEARGNWNVIEVAYHESPQIIVFEDVLTHGEVSPVLGKMIGTKSARWAHEKEIRIVTTKAGQNFYAASAITGVYFGCRCSDDLIIRVRKVLQGRKLAYYQMEFSKDSYSMDMRLLEYDAKIDGVAIEHKAAIEECAIPDIKYIDSQYEEYYPFLELAVEIVRRDPSCEKVLYTDFSTNKSTAETPVVYVQYESNITTLSYKGVTRWFSVVGSELVELI